MWKIKVVETDDEQVYLLACLPDDGGGERIVGYMTNYRYKEADALAQDLAQFKPYMAVLPPSWRLSKPKEGFLAGEAYQVLAEWGSYTLFSSDAQLALYLERARGSFAVRALEIVRQTLPPVTVSGNPQQISLL